MSDPMQDNRYVGYEPGGYLAIWDLWDQVDIGESFENREEWEDRIYELNQEYVQIARNAVGP